jgi:hypothetical protein
MHFCVGTTKTNLLTVLVWFFVNFARKVSLEIFDKIEITSFLMNYASNAKIV